MSDTEATMPAPIGSKTELRLARQAGSPSQLHMRLQRSARTCQAEGIAWQTQRQTASMSQLAPVQPRAWQDCSTEVGKATYQGIQVELSAVQEAAEDVWQACEGAASLQVTAPQQQQHLGSLYLQGCSCSTAGASWMLSLLLRPSVHRVPSTCSCCRAGAAQWGCTALPVVDLKQAVGVRHLQLLLCSRGTAGGAQRCRVWTRSRLGCPIQHTCSPACMHSLKRPAAASCASAGLPAAKRVRTEACSNCILHGRGIVVILHGRAQCWTAACRLGKGARGSLSHVCQCWETAPMGATRWCWGAT